MIFPLFILKASAQGLVPNCPPEQCGRDDLLALGGNVVNALITIGFIVTILFVTIGAFRLIISQGNPEQLTNARKNITSAIVGLVIVLVAWVALNSLINFFIDGDRCEREWWRFQGLQCEQSI